MIKRFHEVTTRSRLRQAIAGSCVSHGLAPPGGDGQSVICIISTVVATNVQNCRPWKQGWSPAVGTKFQGNRRRGGTARRGTLLRRGWSASCAVCYPPSVNGGPSRISRGTASTQCGPGCVRPDIDEGHAPEGLVNCSSVSDCVASRLEVSE